MIFLYKRKIENKRFHAFQTSLLLKKESADVSFILKHLLILFKKSFTFYILMSTAPISATSAACTVSETEISIVESVSFERD